MCLAVILASKISEKTKGDTTLGGTDVGNPTTKSHNLITRRSYLL